MKIKLGNYVIFCISLLLFFAYYVHYSFGLVMTSFFLVYWIFSRGLKKNKISRLGYFFLFFACLLAYFLRGFVLIPHPEWYLFSFSNDLQGNAPAIGALWDIFWFFLVMSLGFWLVVRKGKKIHQRKRKKALFVPHWPLRYFRSLMILFYSVLFIKIAVILFTGAGIKGEDINTSWAFLLRLVPNDLIFIVVAVYFLRYYKYLNKRKKNILMVLSILMSLSILITGSKIFIILLGLCLFIGLLYENIKIGKIRLVFYSLIGLLVIAFSFTMSKVIRISSPDSFLELAGETSEAMAETDYMVLMDMVTGRFIGLDGYLATEKTEFIYNQEVLTKVFGIKNTLLSILEFVVPFVSFTDTMSTGKAVSMYVLGLPSTAVNASAIGLFGAFNLMYPGLVWLLSFFFGIVLAIGYNKIGKLQDPDIKLIVFYFFTYFVIHMFMSGNFNVLVGLLIIKLVLIIIYIKIAKLFKVNKVAVGQIPK